MAALAPAEHSAASAYAAPASSDLAGASRPGPSTGDGRAPLRWPFTSRAQQERVLQRKAAQALSDSDSESVEESQDERGHADSRRGCADSGVSDSADSSQDVSSAVLDSQEAGKITRELMKEDRIQNTRLKNPTV